MRRLVAQRQERRHRAIEAEPVATGFRHQQEPEQEAGESGHADREAGSAGQAATIQTGTACEDRDAEAEVGRHFTMRAIPWALRQTPVDHATGQC